MSGETCRDAPAFSEEACDVAAAETVSDGADFGDMEVVLHGGDGGFDD